jgi:hypothetical protein
VCGGLWGFGGGVVKERKGGGGEGFNEL